MEYLTRDSAKDWATWATRTARVRLRRGTQVRTLPNHRFRPDSVGDLHALTRFLRDQFPGDAHAEFLAFGVASEYLRAVVGNEWVNQVVYGEHTAVDRRSRSGRAFMRAESEEIPELYRKQERVTRLAETLFNLRRIEGLDGRVEALQAGDVESTYAELECARFLAIRGIRFHFVYPTGIKGKDYDAEIPLSDGSAVCLEMKCKVETTAPSAGAVLNPLRNARRQLPANQASMVFLKIPEHWVTRRDTVSASVALAAVDQFLNGTARVVGVVLRWEEQAVLPMRGALIHYKYRVLTHPPRKAHPVEELLGALALQTPLDKDWVSLQAIATEIASESLDSH